MGTLTLLMLIGGYAYSLQLRYGLGVTGMSDHVSWGSHLNPASSDWRGSRCW
jgi:Ni/Fe-hydrogenase subunit HybB-like protein